MLQFFLDLLTLGRLQVGVAMRTPDLNKRIVLANIENLANYVGRVCGLMPRSSDDGVVGLVFYPKSSTVPRRRMRSGESVGRKMPRLYAPRSESCRQLQVPTVSNRSRWCR